MTNPKKPEVNKEQVKWYFEETFQDYWEVIADFLNSDNETKEIMKADIQKQTKGRNYNSRGFLGFSVNHETENWENSVTADAIRKSIIKKLATLNDEDLISVVELDDTIKHDKLF